MSGHGEKTAAFHNLGCKVNAYEMESMEQQLKDAGYRIVDFHETADVYVVNTCTVTNTADKKSRQMLHRARKQNPDAVIVASGCFAQASAQFLIKEGTADIVLGSGQKGKLSLLLEKYLKEGEKQQVLTDFSCPLFFEEMYPVTVPEHTRAFIKIQDGCSQFCSYCVIPYVRGRVRSRQPEKVAEEIKRLAAGGCKEVVLTGIHLSSYGTDLKERPEPVSLLTVLRLIHPIEGITRIRLSSLEPGIITPAFAEELAGMEKVCPHFHLSLQSGCNETLKRMNRHYTTEEYMEKCRLLRSLYLHPALTTDVITGFPGETEEEFAQTLAFAEQVGFYEMHVFPYSARQGTRAASMDGQVSEQEKKSRSSRLLALTRVQSREFRQYYEGKQMEILLEEETEIGGQRFMTGYTPEYIRCAVQSGTRNTLIVGHFSKFLQDDVVLCDGIL